MTYCIHDLDPASCADCNGAVKRAAAARKAERGPWLTARYDGTCPGCGEPFSAGEKIRSDGEGCWLCEDCGDA